MALLAAGYPNTVSCCTTNRQCSSGLQAFVNIAGEIKMGSIKVGIAAGVESMSNGPERIDESKIKNKKLLKVQNAKDCLLPMGTTSELVSKKFNIPRSKQDEFAYQSQKRAFEASKSGSFDDEIVPVKATIKDEKTGDLKEVLVTKDEGIRSTTLESLQKLKPAFAKDGCSTAGNSSQVSDGAALVVAMSRSEAVRRNLPILGRFVSYAVAGCPPSLMGIGPAVAIPKALEKAGLSVKDIDVFEINEAFASQAVYCVEKLGIPMEKVNPLGGAIALGHPLGSTGARLIGTLLHNLRRNKQKYGVVSMCMATGMGAAAVFEAEH
eukprot:TRINITY_DN3776_c0_g1_i3.p1 TRINITY_DN3776_c0_g1~~TRINITY_DN3776_c0_g1_i3.p1  ORF type:complete len:323 (+),score=86.67 TRINITY_DN3776_c0_g1_i3:114-1082(+)